MRVLVPLAAFGAIVLAAATGAFAQGRTGGGGEALLIVTPSEQAQSQRPVPPLAQKQLEQLRRAQSFRQGNLLDRAREILLALNAEVPHHPLVVTEIARVHLARREFAAIERLGRAERMAQRDSLLMTRELTAALEQLHKTREAAQVVLEAWTVAPAESEWATSALLRLAAREPRPVREMMQRFAERAPERFDVLLGVAVLQWQMGDEKGAMRLLSDADLATTGASLRQAFAEQLLERGATRDTSGAIEALLDIAGDPALKTTVRLPAAQRAWDLHRTRGTEAEGAPQMVRALKELAPSRWPAEILGGVVRGLRQAGLTGEARALLRSRGSEAELPPELALEHALADLRDGPPERSLESLQRTSTESPEGAFLFAEALFFAGRGDSALGRYKDIVQDPHDPYSGASLERIYLIEDAQPRDALPVLGRIAYETWRGDFKRAGALSESLYYALPHGPLWAHAALELAARREAAGDAKGALEPLLAVADSLPNDRLAPRARQRAGDVYRTRLKDEAKAAQQYEECLARHPRAWNAPEIRRKLEALRREMRRF